MHLLTLVFVIIVLGNRKTSYTNNAVKDNPTLDVIVLTFTKRLLRETPVLDFNRPW